MYHRSKLVRRIMFVTFCGSLATGTATAMAQVESSVLAQAPVAEMEQPALPPPHVPAVDEAMPAPRASGGVVHPAPPIVYHADRGARRMYRCQETVELLMVTQNPADGCFYEIPLCVPACCLGEPTMTNRCGIFGRGVVDYCWPCGFSATVKFRHVRGDVKVEYDA